MFVYLIRDGETSLYKIGMTHNLESRLKRLNGNQSPNEKYIVFSIEVINAKPIEAILHNRYQKHRHRNEWFCLNDKQVESVKQNMNLLKNNEQIMYSDDYEEENNHDKMSDPALEILADIISLDLNVLDIVFLIQRLSVIVEEKLTAKNDDDEFLPPPTDDSDDDFVVADDDDDDFVVADDSDDDFVVADDSDDDFVVADDDDDNDYNPFV
jgi:hypothetical protein